jgi:hypothetical protein
LVLPNLGLLVDMVATLTVAVNQVAQHGIVLVDFHQYVAA